MATILDRLIIEITAKDEKLQASLRGIDQRVSRFERNVNTSLKKVEGSFSRVSGAVGKFNTILRTIGATAALSGLTALTKNALTATDAIGKTADRLSVSTDFLQEWQFVAARTGVEANTLALGFQRLERRLGQFTATGGGPAQKAFEALGFTVEETRGEFDSLEKIVPEIAKRFKTLGTEAEQLAIAQQLVDSEAAGLVVAFRLSTDALQGLQDQAHETGGVLERDLIDQASRLKDEFDVASLAIENKFQTALVNLAPVITGTLDLLARLASGVGEVVESIRNIPNLTADVVQSRTLALNSLLQDQITLQRQLASLQARVGEGTVSPGTEQRIEALKDRLGEVSVAITATREDLKDLAIATDETGEAAGKAGPPLKALGDGYRKAGEGAKKGRTEVEKFTDSIAKQIKALESQVDIFGLSAAEVIKYEAAQIRATAGGEALADTYERLKLELLALNEGQEAAQEKLAEEEAAVEAAQEAWDAYQEQLMQSREQQADLLNAHDDEIAALNREAEALQQVLADGQVTDDELRELAITQEELRLQAEGATDAMRGEADTVRALATETIDARAKVDALTEAQQNAGQAAQELGNLFQQAVSDILRSGGSLNSLPGLLNQIGQRAGTNFVSGLLFGAQTAGPVQGLSGIFNQAIGVGQGGLFAQLGLGSGTQFGNAFGIAAGAAGIAGLVAGIAGGSANAQLGATIGTFALGPLGGLAGGIIGEFLFGGPGRITKELKDIERAFEQITGLRAHATFERFRHDAEINFQAVEEALHAVGLAYSLELGEVAIGTIERVGNLSQAAFERHNLSIEEAEGHVLRLAQAYGVNLLDGVSAINRALAGDTDLTLNNYGENLAEASDEVVTLGGLLLGTLQIATQFNDSINTQAIVQQELARAFAETADAAGLQGEQFEDLTAKILAGELILEEALLQLRALAGVDLDLGDINFDAAHVEQLLQDQLFAFEAAGVAAGQAIAQGLAAGITDSALVEQAVLESLNISLFNRALDDLLNDQLQPLFDALDFTGPLDLNSQAVLDFAAGVGQVFDNARALREEFFGAAEGVDALTDALVDVTNETETILNQIRSLTRAIAGIGNQRITVEIDFIRNLQGIGALSGLDAIELLTGSAQRELDLLLSQRVPLPRRSTPTRGPEPPAALSPTGRNVGGGEDRVLRRGPEPPAALSPTGRGLDASLKRVPISLADLERALELNNTLTELTVERFEAEVAERTRETSDRIRAQEVATAQIIAGIQRQLNADLSRIRATTQAQRAAGEARIEALNREKDQIQENGRIQIDALKQQLRVAQDFARVADSLGNQVRQLALGSGSALALPQQSSLLDRQAQILRQQIGGASQSDLPGLFTDLANTLGAQLNLGLLASQDPRQHDLFNSILSEIEDLQAQAEAEGAQIVPIEEQILAAEQSMEISLTNIDAAIASQRDHLTRLSEQERVAIDIAQQRASQAVADAESELERFISVQNKFLFEGTEILRQQTVGALDTLRAQEHALLSRQQAILEEQREDLKAQLVELVGIEEATRLLANDEGALLLTLIRIDATLSKLTSTLENIIPAAGGFRGVAIRPSLFLAGERGPENVHIAPFGAIQPGGEALNFSPTFHVNTPPGEANPQAFGRSFGQGVVEVVLQDMRPGGRINRELRRGRK